MNGLEWQVETETAGGGNVKPLIEEDLLASLRRGDEHAFETLVREYGGRMLAVARRLLRNEEAAEDAVQDAFLAAFRSIHRFKADSKLSTWLHRIVVNAALMKLRTRRRKPEESIEPLLPVFDRDGHHVLPVAEWRRAFEGDVEREDLKRLVHRSIDSLPASYRAVLVLRDIEELDTGETAKILGITVTAAKIRLHRARQALRTLLDPHLRPASARATAREPAAAARGAKPIRAYAI